MYQKADRLFQIIRFCFLRVEKTARLNFMLTLPFACNILLVVVGATLLRSCAVLVASAAFLYLSRSVDIFGILRYNIIGN